MGYGQSGRKEELDDPLLLVSFAILIVSSCRPVAEIHASQKEPIHLFWCPSGTKVDDHLSIWGGGGGGYHDPALPLRGLKSPVGSQAIRPPPTDPPSLSPSTKERTDRDKGKRLEEASVSWSPLFSSVSSPVSVLQCQYPVSSSQWQSSPVQSGLSDRMPVPSAAARFSWVAQPPAFVGLVG